MVFSRSFRKFFCIKFVVYKFSSPNSGFLFIFFRAMFAINFVIRKQFKSISGLVMGRVRYLLLLGFTNTTNSTFATNPISYIDLFTNKILWPIIFNQIRCVWLTLLVNKSWRKKKKIFKNLKCFWTNSFEFKIKPPFNIHLHPLIYLE